MCETHAFLVKGRAESRKRGHLWWTLLTLLTLCGDLDGGSGEGNFVSHCKTAPLWLTWFCGYVEP